MACSLSSTKVPSDARVDRELFRYYVPEDKLHPSPHDEHAPKASTDPILTAFAQLGALRLNARRGMITLTTNNTAYILAESGQNLSLQQDNDTYDQLWHGVGLLKNRLGLGPGIHETFMDPNNHAEYLFIGDLSKDDRFKDVLSVREDPHLRALWCIPLKAPNGLIIGKYLVLDDIPREDICEAHIHFLQDMAVTVMDYLEASRMKMQQFRAERMVKAMGLFIEGKASLREWWLEHGHKYQVATKKRHKDLHSVERQADAEFGVQETVDYFSRSGLSGLQNGTPQSSSGPPSPSSSGPSQADRGDGRPPIPRADTMLSDTLGSATPLSKSWQERNSSVTTFETLAEQTPEEDKRPEFNKHPSVSFDLPPEESLRDHQNAVLSADVKGVFARASNLIREAIGVEGVIYFDASVGSFVGSSERDEKAPGAFDVERTTTSSEDELLRRMSDIELEETRRSEKPAEIPERYCDVLGFSTRKRSSLRGHVVSPEHQRMPEMILRKLLKRYPHGKVFNFDEDGSFSSSESDHNPSVPVQNGQARADDRTDKNRRKRVSRQFEAATILSVLPGARSVFWFPLWDQNRERWFSGSLVWSTCPTRTLCPTEDITYLAAFGNSTMAEISRLSAAVLSKMKTDFISSISHELRSPLHGVLASVEFLQETDMTEVQSDMVNNIHASGKVLLDTINHVLDFSKVNRKAKNRRKIPRRRSKKGRRQSVDDSAEEKADICMLSEEVIESIYAGRSMGKKAFDSMGHRRHPSSGSHDPPVTIITDIQWRSNWTYEVDAGAWRRILMNLFNNAMKYTKTGFIKVSMEIEEDISSARKTPRSNLTLKVKDSGKGISQEFLRHQLYKPFTQEDHLATGAGLGLSIVKAVVQDLGGRIDVSSEPGTGTEATVRIPLTSATPIQIESLNIVHEVRNKVKGLRFTLDGFERYPDISEAPTGILSADAEGAMLLKAAVHSSLVEWYGMEQAAVSPESNGAEVVVIMESGLGDRTLEDTLQSFPSREDKAVAIVLTSSYHSGPKVDAHDHFRIFYLQQPYGPHKVAKILYQAFCLNLVDHLRDPEIDAHVVSPSFESPTIVCPLDAGSLSPTSATQDFATLSPSQPLIPPKEIVTPITPPSDVTSAPEPPKVDDIAAVPAIPPLVAPPTASEPAPPTVTLQQEDGLRVLLVEDNEINLKLLIATMRKLKLDHVTATNGLEALNSYKENEGNFDVIFMDISMPVMSGIESTRHIRRFEKENGLQPVALIALTGAANPSTRQEAFSSGVDLFLTKPVPMKALRDIFQSPQSTTCRQGVVASQAGPSSAQHRTTAPITAAQEGNPRIASPSFQPPYPSPSPIPASTPDLPEPQVRVTSPTRWSLRNAFTGSGTTGPDFASPFRNRSGTGGSSIARGRQRRPSAARLWNPSNSTPRGPSQPRRRERERSAEVIAVPLRHPDLGLPNPGATAGGEYPLLTLPEQRQSRHSGSTRASLQIERSGSSTGTSNRVSLPRSVSIDNSRRNSGLEPKVDKGKGIAVEPEEPPKKLSGFQKTDQTVDNTPGLSYDKGKGKMTDLERGPDPQYEPGGTSNLPHSESNTSLPDGIGPAVSSSNTSIIGSDGRANPAEEWGPQHPCFPHMNPHVPLSSPLYQTTRIIRVRRDWMIEGDLAPTFSNLYPEILDPAGVSEQEFRTLVERVNNELVPAFSPWGLRNMFDAMMGLLTGWVWDDLGFTAVKSRLSKVERLLEDWNREMEGRTKEGAEGSAPRIVPLRRTGYMNLDIQVPDPEISYPSSIPADERPATGLSQATE